MKDFLARTFIIAFALAYSAVLIVLVLWSVLKSPATRLGRPKKESQARPDSPESKFLDRERSAFRGLGPPPPKESSNSGCDKNVFSR